MNKKFCRLLNISIAHSNSYKRNQLREEKSKSYKEIKRMEKRGKKEEVRKGKKKREKERK